MTVPAMAPSMAPCCSAGNTSPNVIATGVRPRRPKASLWNCEAKTRTFLPLKSARWRIAALAMTDDGCEVNRPTPCKPLSAPSPSSSLRTSGSCGEALRLGQRVDQAGRRHHLEALVDAGIEFRRRDHALDGAELRAFDLPRDRAELARRIDFGLDAAAGLLVDQGGVILGELVQRLVERRERNLHHDRRLVFGARRAGRQRASRGENAGGGSRAQQGFMGCEAHVVLPWRRPFLLSLGGSAGTDVKGSPRGGQRRFGALRRSDLAWSSSAVRSLAASRSRVNVAVELLPAVRIL